MKRSHAGTSSNSYGYFVGGIKIYTDNTVDRLDFSNETTSEPGNNLPGARDSMGTVSN